MSCLQAVGSFVSGFARLILFIASIVFLLSSLLLFAFTYQSKRDFANAKVDNINTGLTVLVGLSIYLTVLAIIGIFASFFSNRNTIKLLACMLTLNVVIGIAVLVSSSPKFEDAHNVLAEKFKDYQAIYKWDHEKTDNYDVMNATEAWDNLQTDSHCCGLKSPDDWTQFRPKTVGIDMLPVSCCQRRGMIDGEPLDTNDNSTAIYCDRKTEKYWSEGCSMEIQGAFAAIIYMVFALVGFSLVLGILATIVIVCHPDDRYYNDYHPSGY